ncbi:MAG: sigma-70 family RNA polymerase sigma factor [Clostridia bacterium]|nr:sigma-70 family RNA polymerase sigma factor [Clostridia bacterium]
MKHTEHGTVVLEDEQIIELFLKRSPDAIEETQRKYARYLFSVAKNMLESAEDCEECINDTYLALWQSIPPHHPHSFKVYVTSLLRRHATNIYRKQTRQKRIPTELIRSLSELEYAVSDGTFGDDEGSQKQLAAALNDFLGSLPKEERALFVCRYYLGQSVEDLAHTLHVSTHVIYRRLNKQRTKLKDFLSKEGYTL